MACLWLVLAIASGSGMAQDLKLYPGSTPDQKASRDASTGRSESEVFTTPDSFERLYTFYKGHYKEAHWPLPAPKLPSGKDVQWAFFILDDGKDLMHSKYWLKIQRPYIRTVNEELDFKDIRDVCVIQTVRRK